jgi:hypothetical protein
LAKIPIDLRPISQFPHQILTGKVTIPETNAFPGSVQICIFHLAVHILEKRLSQPAFRVHSTQQTGPIKPDST